MPKFIDLSGKIFGQLTVIQRTKNRILKSGKPRTMWLCKCSCGEYTVVSSQSLTQGTTVSCGHIGKENRIHGSNKRAQKIIGEKYGKLTVLYRCENRVQPNGTIRPRWCCECQCGNRVIVAGCDLRSGSTSSCGCIKSKGQQVILSLLQKNNIEYVKQYSFSDLWINDPRCPLMFDFAIMDKNKLLCLVEYQGIQHYNDDEFGKFVRQKSDPKKKQYCAKNNILLYQIRYDENIEEKINYLLQNILHVNAVPSSAQEKV